MSVHVGVFSNEGIRNRLENMLSGPQPFLAYNIFSKKDLLDGSRKRKNPGKYSKTSIQLAYFKLEKNAFRLKP